MKETIQAFGRFAVIREKLTDGSGVYSVQFPSDDGPSVIIACNRLNRALSLAEQLQGTAVDVSVRDMGD